MIRKAAVWLIPTMANRPPATMLIDPLSTIPPRPGRQREVKMAECRRHCGAPVDVPGEVGDTSVEMVDRPDLSRGCEKVEHQADGEGLGQPWITASDFTIPRMTWPPKNEQRDRDDGHDDRV